MTANPLDLIEARALAATSGPWVADELGNVETVPEFDLHRFDIMPETIARTELRKEDGVFIAAARTDVPKMVAAIRAIEDFCDTSEAHVRGTRQSVRRHSKHLR